MKAIARHTFKYMTETWMGKVKTRWLCHSVSSNWENDGFYLIRWKTTGWLQQGNRTHKPYSRQATHDSFHPSQMIRNFETLSCSNVLYVHTKHGKRSYLDINVDNNKSPHRVSDLVIGCGMNMTINILMRLAVRFIVNGHHCTGLWSRL